MQQHCCLTAVGSLPSGGGISVSGFSNTPVASEDLKGCAHMQQWQLDAPLAPHSLSLGWRPAEPAHDLSVSAYHNLTSFLLQSCQPDCHAPADLPVSSKLGDTTYSGLI